MILFVYGTLKNGFPAHDLMAGSTFLGEARTVPGFQLYAATKYYPMMVAETTENAVEGELWEVPEYLLSQLDFYEGPSYERAFIELQEPHAEKSVMTYLYRGRVAGLKVIGPRWNSR
jgi:gamma-glutamylcyclotransferase (GGCT)/AIG2-like uncharacterized protein YtfP